MSRSLVRALAAACLVAFVAIGCGTSSGDDAKGSDKTAASDASDQPSSDEGSSDEVSSDDVASDDVSSDDVASDELTDDDSSDDGGSDLVEGDGSEYCFSEDDLPDGFLPLAGKDNTSNALSYVFDDPAISDVAGEHLAASWMELPDGGAAPTDLTADCTVYLFDDQGSADEVFAWYVDTFTDRGSPPATEQEVTDAAPGDDPHLFTKDVGGRPTATLVFQYENAIVSVGIDGSVDNDTDQVAGAVEELAGVPYQKLSEG
jgi:hypothetical protein